MVSAKDEMLTQYMRACMDRFRKKYSHNPTRSLA